MSRLLSPKKAAAASTLVVILLSAATYFAGPVAGAALTFIAGAIRSPLTDLLSAK